MLEKYHDRKFFGGILWNCDCNRNVSRTWNRLLDGKTDRPENGYLFDLALVAIICSVIGARVYYVIFRWDLYKDDLLSVFNLRQGGLAIYGGVIAAIITVFVFSRVRKLSMGLLCDTAGLGLVLGQVIGRWGNFLTGRHLAVIRTGCLPCSCRFLLSDPQM